MNGHLDQSLQAPDRSAGNSSTHSRSPVNPSRSSPIAIPSRRRASPRLSPPLSGSATSPSPSGSVPPGGMFSMDREAPAPYGVTTPTVPPHSMLRSGQPRYPYPPAAAAYTRSTQGRQQGYREAVRPESSNAPSGPSNASSRTGVSYPVYPTAHMVIPPSYHTPSAQPLNPPPPPYSSTRPSPHFPASPATGYYGGVQAQPGPPPYNAWPQGRPPQTGGSATAARQHNRSGETTQPGGSSREQGRRTHGDRR